MPRPDVRLVLDGLGGGEIMVGDHDLSDCVRAVDVRAVVNRPAEVVLYLAMPAGITVEGPAEVVLPEATRLMLVDLGWTPPGVEQG